MGNRFRTIGIQGFKAHTKAMLLLLLFTSAICFGSVLIPVGDGIKLRSTISLVTGAYLLSVFFFLRQTNKLDYAMYLAALGGLASLLTHFYVSGHVFYLAMTVTVPLAATIFLGTRHSLIVLIAFTFGVLFAAGAVEFGFWNPMFSQTEYLDSLWVVTFIVVFVGQAMTIASIWKQRLSRKYETIVNGYCDGIIETDQKGIIKTVGGEYFHGNSEKPNSLTGQSFIDLITDEFKRLRRRGVSKSNIVWRRGKGTKRN